MTSLKTSIKTITYLSDTGCLEIQGASLLCIFYLLFKHVHKECFHYANDTCKEESPGQSDSGA
ncbi:hypothetical protein DRD10_23510 [Salmonella enterica subsp. enterica serovar Give]|nr:hypothetical protein [Salmonella enterica subsp. enterica serovar Give]